MAILLFLFIAIAAANGQQNTVADAAHQVMVAQHEAVIHLTTETNDAEDPTLTQPSYLLAQGEASTLSIRESEQYAMVDFNDGNIKLDAKAYVQEPEISTSNNINAETVIAEAQAAATELALADVAPVVVARNTPQVALSNATALSMAPKEIEWEIRVEDVRLDKALRRWANEAGYTLRWDADRYVLISASTVFTGSFEKAVEKVLDTPGIKFSEYPLEACVYANQPPLLRITRLGDQTDICK